MPGIVEFPTIVQQAVEQFGAVFANEPERRHFAEYLTGLLVAAKKIGRPVHWMSIVSQQMADAGQLGRAGAESATAGVVATDPHYSLRRERNHPD